jgi:glycosyltransferase involved in cell wall biosynthesis
MLLPDVSSTPTFSVVMPAYNTSRTIGTAIESVLAQTRQDFELIVVDDGSTDDTRDRIEPYLRDQRVRVICQRNLGPVAARNAAIVAARGHFVSLLDSDDVWLPRYLDVMATTLEADAEAAVAYTDAWVLDDETRRIARATATSPFHPPTAPTEPQQFLRALLELGNFIFVGATIRLAALADVGPFRVGLEAGEDYELWLRLAARGYRFARCSEILVIYRRRPGQLSAQVERMRRAGREVMRIVEEEYAVSDDIRVLAREGLALARAFRTRPPTRVPHLLRRPYEAVSRLRHFYVRPPREVRAAFSDLRVL